MKKEVLFEVPSRSQHLDVGAKKWRSNSCGIVSVKMVLDYYRQDPPTVASLIRQGVALGGYIPGIGWRHKALAELGVKHGLRGRNFDWAKLTQEEAWLKLKRHLAKGPVIASIYKDLQPGKSGHLVVVTGYRNGFVLMNDPDSKSRKNISRRASLKKFLRGYKKRAIVLR